MCIQTGRYKYCVFCQAKTDSEQWNANEHQEKYEYWAEMDKERQRRCMLSCRREARHHLSTRHPGMERKWLPEVAARREFSSTGEAALNSCRKRMQQTLGVPTRRPFGDPSAIICTSTKHQHRVILTMFHPWRITELGTAPSCKFASMEAQRN